MKFNDIRGKGESSGPIRFKYVDGENRVRLFGDVLPEYKYWLKSADGKNIPMPCLAFDSEEEKFIPGVDKDGNIVDYVKHYFPDRNASWAYMCMCIDRSDGKIKLLDFKKTLFNQIQRLAKKLGDPTDAKNGWDIIFTKEKTGPSNFDVEYTLDQISSSETKGPLTEEELEMIAEQAPIHEVAPKRTPEEQKRFIEEKILGGGDEDEDAEALAELS